MKIEKPGHYRARNNEKVEVVAVRKGYAVGFCAMCPLTWIDDGRNWNYVSGAEGSSRLLDLVAEWRDPETAECTVELCRSDGGHVFTRFAYASEGPVTVLARKTITITEGEGMK